VPGTADRDPVPGFGISSVEHLDTAGIFTNDIIMVIIITTTLSLNEGKESMIVKSSVCLGNSPEGL
jgi:hypothetical protein